MLVSAKERLETGFDDLLRLSQVYKDAEENVKRHGLCLRGKRPEVDAELAQFLRSLL